MKEEKEQMSAIGSALTMMVEMIIIRMLQPMKEQIQEIKSDIESIKVWCAEYISVEKFNELIMSVKDMRSDFELSINEAINSIELPTLSHIEDIEKRLVDLEVDVESNTEDNAKADSRIEENEILIGNVVSKLGLIGDILFE